MRRTQHISRLDEVETFHDISSILVWKGGESQPIHPQSAMGMRGTTELKLDSVVEVVYGQWGDTTQHNVLYEHLQSVLEVQSCIEKVVADELMLGWIGL